MRKVIVSNLISLDGFIAGPNGEIDWFVSIADKEFERYAIEIITSVDTMVFGRITYQLMEQYWPTATTATDDQWIIDAMNSYPKIVFSRTLKKTTWNNSRLITGNLAEEVATMKRQPGKDMVIYGSGTIVSQLAQEALIDEYRIFVAPVVLGNGVSMFTDIKNRIQLKPRHTRMFNSGLTLLHFDLDRT